MTPSAFSGGWQRDGVSVGDEALREPATAIWLQAGDRYVDIRTSFEPSILNGPGAFGGTTTFSNNTITSTHHIACPSRPVIDGPSTADAVDTGHVSWHDYDTFTETGSVPTSSGVTMYEELWRRIPDAQNGPAFSLVPAGGEGIAVRCGRHVAALYRPESADGDRWAAVHLRERVGRWAIHVQLGDHVECGRLASSLLAAIGGAHSFDQPATTKWTIDELVSSLAS